jgi:hypothetical protein
MPANGQLAVPKFPAVQQRCTETVQCPDSTAMPENFWPISTFFSINTQLPDAKSTNSVRGQACGANDFSGLQVEAIIPVADKKLFLGREKCVGPADDGPQSGHHLQRSKQKNDYPDIQAGGGFCPGMRKTGLQKSQAKTGGDEPEQQMKKAHPGNGFRGL